MTRIEEPQDKLSSDSLIVQGYRKPRSRGNRRLIVLVAVVVALAAVLAAHGIYDYVKSREKPKSVPVVPGESISIFVLGEQGRLVEKKLETKAGMSERQKADAIIAALKKEKCLPEALALHDFTIGENGVVFLNFSKDIRNAGIGTAQEIAMVYSIMNSFTANFRNAERVQLLAEGQPFETIGGLIYTYKPIEPNKGLLED